MLSRSEYKHLADLLYERYGDPDDGRAVVVPAPAFNTEGVLDGVNLAKGVVNEAAVDLTYNELQDAFAVVMETVADNRSPSGEHRVLADLLRLDGNGRHLFLRSTYFPGPDMWAVSRFTAIGSIMHMAKQAGLEVLHTADSIVASDGTRRFGVIERKVECDYPSLCVPVPHFDWRPYMTRPRLTAKAFPVVGSYFFRRARKDKTEDQHLWVQAAMLLCWGGYTYNMAPMRAHVGNWSGTYSIERTANRIMAASRFSFGDKRLTFLRKTLLDEGMPKAEVNVIIKRLKSDLPNWTNEKNWDSFCQNLLEVYLANHRFYREIRLRERHSSRHSGDETSVRQNSLRRHAQRSSQGEVRAD